MGGPLARIHRFNNRGRPGNYITTGKYSRNIGLKCLGIDFQRIPFIHFQLGLISQEIKVRFLSNGRNNSVGLNKKLGTLHRNGFSPARGIRLGQAGADTLDTGDLAVFTYDLQRRNQVMDLDVFSFSLFHLFVFRRHFLAGPAIDDVGLIRAQAKRHPGAVQSGMATADNNGFPFQLGQFPQVYIRQKRGDFYHAFDLFARYSKLQPFPGTGADKDGLGAMLLELFNGKIFSNGGVGVNFYSVAFQVFDLRIKDAPWETVFGNAVPHHAAGLRHGLIDADLITLLSQKIGCRKSCRT